MSERSYPSPAAQAGRAEPAPRRVRGYVGATLVFDTTRASYVWDWPFYPQYAIPADDVVPGVLEPDGERESLPHGEADRQRVVVADDVRPEAAHVYTEAAGPVAGMVRFAWDALDSWFEEDEQIFVHPRNPYVRVDAMRSSRHVRVELDGVLLAESRAPVLLFETGLPTRYYLDPCDVRFEHLRPSSTCTPCPYKGRTSAYWSVQIGDDLHEDLAWRYDYPTPAVASIAGLIGFYNERVDLTVDGVRLKRPNTHF